ncbi:response regulator transcription factor [Paenibacillus sp. LHD-117]|uniref:response regulator transcription factor n=1 Tax=Paenibacillus sp. LHD-117 TaxID=3071412 RepID=UPI0027E1CA4D|nr:response regulator transcription factor [Paenibacillus sp. LHD-117]MDQ6419391.1 response regulator transcription factor [Paenibacillus sp. LHD-117]
MYKVLIVDDERIILEGIAGLMEWEKYGTKLVGTARNGLEALEFIQANRPDIVISDIRMPGMDGLKLAERTREQYPSIAFIMLSGFGEFDYARQAMQFGVKHYLLKPCNENTIGEALSEVVGQLDEHLRKEKFLANLQMELQQVLPSAKEQFLKELVTNKMYGRGDWDRYKELFGIEVEHAEARLLLLQLEGQFEFEHLFALKNIAEELIGCDQLVLSTTIGNQALLLVRNTHPEEKLLAILREARNTFKGYYRLDTTIAVSDPGPLTDARRMYLDTLKCMSFRFYLGEGSIITVGDTRDDGGVEAGHGGAGDRSAEPAPGAEGRFLYDDARLCLYAKSGHLEAVMQELGEVFKALEEQRHDDVSAKSYIIPIYVALIRQADPSSMNDYLKELGKLESIATMQGLKSFVEEKARLICQTNYENQKRRHSTIIAQIHDIVGAHIANPDLSLQWVASEILYMNADYLGKLFRKETGEKFSNHVMKVRMDRAVELIGGGGDVKVFELAEQLGFGDNPQYFSQVFKKYTGVSPTEYKRLP